ncbi:MAG: type I secretion system permease/ATPase [Alphaproteobacteria bacterium]|nr:type I secretion system permease/ATPase [Alphaproteobacteria bacterium]
MSKNNNDTPIEPPVSASSEVEMIDPLLQCLVFLTAHYGRAKSADALTAGLAYDARNMGPDLFAQAAERLGLKTKVVKRPHIREIPSAVLPVVLILKGEQACVLMSLHGSKAQLYMPETQSSVELELEKLESDYTGYSIYTHPRSEFTNPQSVHKDDTDRHWFWGLVEENRRIYAMALLGGAFINLFGLASPLFIMNVYDRVIPNNAIETGWALGIGALIVFGFDLVMRILRAYLIDMAGRRIDVIAGRRIYDQVLNMRIAGRPASSGVFANMLKDFDSVRDFFTSASVTVLVDLPFTLFFLFVIYQIGGGIALILIGLIFAVFLIGLILQRPLKALVRKATQSSEAKHGLLVETIHGLETVKAIGADGRFRARYGEYLGENAAYGQRSRFVSGLGVNVATFLQQIASIIIVLAGMYMVQDGTLTVGGLIACVILGGRAISPIGQIANLMARYHQAGSALKTLENVMNKEVERPQGKQFLHRPDLNGKLSFDKVSFAYPGVGRKVLDNVTFTINTGEKVGIIGRIGSGKSTIARLIMGLYEPDEGTILADDTDYRQIDPADLRRHAAYIAQDVVLFTGSVRDNISASVPHASEEEILEAAKSAGVHDFIARHPMGYDAPVGEHGAQLSGGQRQAIALARALLLKPKILVCDEPTNAMDTQAEAAFKDYVSGQTDDKTLLLITHKQALLPMVDRLILMDQGRIIMDGARDKVLKVLQAGNVQVQE